MAHMNVVAVNKKARFDYHIDEVFEAGLVLTGSEVKSLRLGRVQLREAYAAIERGEAFLHQAHIAPYEKAGNFGHEPTRVRKLLLHRKEISSLLGSVRQKGVTLVPLRLYFNDRGVAKIELGLGRGKKKYDKRAAIAERDAKRAIDRARKEQRQVRGV